MTRERCTDLNHVMSRLRNDVQLIGPRRQILNQVDPRFFQMVHAEKLFREFAQVEVAVMEAATHYADVHFCYEGIGCQVFIS